MKNPRARPSAGSAGAIDSGGRSRRGPSRPPPTGMRGAAPLRVDELGAHMSIAGGLHLALERGHAIGCGAVQIFLKNQRQWAAKPLGADEARAFHAARRKTRIRHVFAHASYLINLAAPGDAQWRQAVDAFVDELERAETLGLSCVVIHPGSHMGAGRDAGVLRVVAALDEAARRTGGYRVRIALENTAGAGNVIGSRLPELGELLRRAAHPERLGVCIDTCHLYAAGHDIRAETGWTNAVEAWAEHVGFSRILAFHLNDARAPLGSGLDRHEHIGKGFLGLAPFRRLLNDPRFARIPKVLETAKEPEPIADIRNLATLRRLRRPPISGRR
jgi:deoxyribonuclease-4